MKKFPIIILLFLIALIGCSQKLVKITNLEQLKDKRVSFLTGSASDIAARKAFPNAKLMDMVSPTDAALSVKTNKCDAFIYNKSILLKLVEKQPALTLLNEAVDSVSVAVAIKKENTQLLENINSVIQKFSKEGTLQEVKDKWLNFADGKEPSLPEIESLPNNGTLKLGVCPEAEPLAYISNNKVVGLDVELANLIAKELNMNLEIIKMPFESLIPALQADKIDFALSNFNVTEERKNYISFSDPYLVNKISALVRK